jgi:hypothetical protein
MSNHGADDTDTSRSLVSNRTMDIVVAALLIALSSLYIWDSWRIGFGWIEGQGPAAGFFPFWIAIIMGGASLINLVRAFTHAEEGGRDSFVSRTAFARVLMVLIPTAAYVLLIHVLGIYVASALFIVGFMLVSREPVITSVLVGLGVPVALFFMFEKWFLVPLPKGPLEAMLGIG